MTHQTQDPLIDAIEDNKQHNLGQLLLKAARLYNETALSQLPAELNLSPAHTQLIPHIDWRGSRITDLAKKIGISKQAVGQLVSELENMGWVQRCPDPSDGRAKIVRFTETGKNKMIRGLGTLKQVEQTLAQSMGDEQITTLKQSLEHIIDQLSPTQNK